MKRFALAAFLPLILTGNIAMATEEPAFQVVIDDGAFQVRDYPPLVVAQTAVAGDRGQAGNGGFRILASYIFGANTRRESIAMTAPVMQSSGTGEKIAMTAPVSQTRADDAWIVQFVMPADRTLANLPMPDDPRVTLTVAPAVRMAVVRFSGWANDRDFQRKSAELEQWTKRRGLRVAGPASLAQYNPPWTLGPLRRNEVMLPVQTPAER